MKHESTVIKSKDALQSDRKAALRGDDVTANIELDAYFYAKYQDMCKALNIGHEHVRALLEREGNLVTMLDGILGAYKAA